MKRIAEILVPLLIVVVGVAVCFQGLPWQFRVKDEYGLMHRSDLMEIDTDGGTPEGWKEYTQSGVTFTAPAGLVWDSEEKRFTDDKQETYVYIFSSGEEYFPETKSVDELLAQSGLDAADLRYFCSRTQKKYPRDEFEFMEMIGRLEPTDLDIHSYRQSRIFFSLADLCTPLFDSSTHFGVFRKNECRGFVVANDGSFDETADPFTAVRLYDQRKAAASVTIGTGNSSSDLEIAASLRLAEATED